MRIALLGYGLEAKSAHHFLREKFPNAFFDIYDQNKEAKIDPPKNAELHLGVKNFNSINADLIVRTPAVNPYYLPKDIPVTSVTKLFFENCPAKIIGVTGTKGKGTTASLIASILNRANQKVHLVGNIGLPALDVLDIIKDTDIVVYELSSFQLWDMNLSPQVAVSVMVEPDHLDKHPDFSDYLNAKSNISRHQREGDVSIYYGNNNNSKYIASFGEGAKKSYANDKNVYVENGYFMYNEQKICPTSSLSISGNHNIENACGAILACIEIAKINDFKLDNTAIERGLADFTGLPHRLKLVMEYQDVKFYDDSISTTPGSTIAAINAFSSPKILILGGSSKGADLSSLYKKIAEDNTIKKVVIIGSEADNIEKELTNINYNNFINLGIKTDMGEVVGECFKNADRGDVIVLSPAHASFDMFKSYSDRGDKFVEAVKQLCYNLEHE